MTRLRTGSARFMVTGQFASIGSIGFAMIVLASVRFPGHARNGIERGSALAIGGLMILVALIGVVRASRMEVRVEASHITVLGVTGTHRLSLADVDYVGYGRSSVGRVLFVICQDGRPIMAWGVSHRPGPPTSEATAALESVRAAAESSHDLPLIDPLLQLPIAPMDPMPGPPEGSLLETPTVSLARITLPGLLSVFAVGLVVFLGLQAALPWEFPWLIVAGLAMPFVFGVLPVVLVTPWLRKRLSGTAAVGDQWLSFKRGTHWLSIDLRQLAGVGAFPTAMAGLLSRTRVRRTLRLVDSDGHRLDIEELHLTRRVVSAIREVASSVPRTDMAQEMLSAR